MKRQEFDDTSGLLGTPWRHVRTGKVRQVVRIVEGNESAAVFLVDNEGREISVTPGQLKTLYEEADEPDALAGFPAIDDEGRPVHCLTIGRLTLELVTPVSPLSDRRRFNNGSVQTAGH